MPGRIQAATGADYKRIFAVLAQKETFLPNIAPLLNEIESIDN